MADCKYPEVSVQLDGLDGNAFSIMGRVTGALRKHLRSLELPHEEVKKIIDEYTKEAMSGDYHNLLCVTCDWVDTF